MKRIIPIIAFLLISVSIHAQITRTVYDITINETSIDQTIKTLENKGLKTRIESDGHNSKIIGVGHVQFGGIRWQNITISFSNDEKPYSIIFKQSSLGWGLAVTETMDNEYEELQTMLKDKYRKYYRGKEKSSSSSSHRYIDNRHHTTLILSRISGSELVISLEYIDESILQQSKQSIINEL